MQRAWVAFDVLLIVGLAALVHRWRDWLGTTLALAVSADAALTLWQSVTWYIPHSTGVPDLLLMAIAATGPSLAAVVLWGTVARQRVALR